MWRNVQTPDGIRGQVRGQFRGHSIIRARFAASHAAIGGQSRAVERVGDRHLSRTSPAVRWRASAANANADEPSVRGPVGGCRTSASGMAWRRSMHERRCRHLPCPDAGACASRRGRNEARRRTSVLRHDRAAWRHGERRRAQEAYLRRDRGRSLRTGDGATASTVGATGTIAAADQNASHARRHSKRGAAA